MKECFFKKTSELVNDKEIKSYRKIKFQVLDSTNKAYSVKSKKVASEYVKEYKKLKTSEP